MENAEEKIITSIERKWSGMPTIVDGIIGEDCHFENSLVSGWGTIIIDDKFISEMIQIANEDLIKTSNLAEKLNSVNYSVNNYFYSKEKKNISRQDFYDMNIVCNEEGMVIGTKLSSMKGQNIAVCSEKSIAAYIILQTLCKKGEFKRKPMLVTSFLKTADRNNSVPHAFIIIKKDDDEYPTKYIIFDVENPTLVETADGQKGYYVGLYCLTDEQYDDFINGNSCTPTSIYEIYISECRVVEAKRTYGRIQKDKSL